MARPKVSSTPASVESRPDASLAVGEPRDDRDPVEKFRETLTDILRETAASRGWIGNSRPDDAAVCGGPSRADAAPLLNSTDLNEAWLRYAPSFYGDAVRNFNEWPEYCLACAGYLGMAVAHLWDKDWARHEKEPYSFFLGKRGFDDMDDRITDEILHERKPAVPAMQDLSAAAQHFLMKECPEPGTALAYRMFLAAEEVMYRIGAAIELSRLGYRMEKM